MTASASAVLANALTVLSMLAVVADIVRQSAVLAVMLSVSVRAQVLRPDAAMKLI
jgi:hypothetical protein